MDYFYEYNFQNMNTISTISEHKKKRGEGEKKRAKRVATANGGEIDLILQIEVLAD